jgi:phosphate starvation-inducible protein PhoH and related proteins
MSKKLKKIRTTQVNGNGDKSDNDSSLFTPIKPKTEGQSLLLRAIEKSGITICDGPAGTGKTFISFASALRYLVTDITINKIVIVRPTYTSGREPSIGYLPGTLDEKMGPFMAPIMKDSAPLLIRHSDVESVISKLDIEVVPLQFMRGRTFHNSFIILDEAQNCNMDDFRMFLTRIGRYSRVVIEGDASQADRSDSALRRVMNELEGLSFVSNIYLQNKDVIRSPMVRKILERLG